VIIVDDLFTLDEGGAYYYRKGYNPAAIKAVAVSGAISLTSVILPKLGGVLTWLPQYGWFVGCGLGFATYYFFALRANVAGSADRRAAAVTEIAEPTEVAAAVPAES
jgi:NCS1 family nucleobase:cation symporter-1